MSYRLAPRAVDDIEAIADHIAQVNPPAAERLLLDFTRHFNILAAYPNSGASRSDILFGIRHVVMGRYIALYHVKESDVEIVRVLHGRREIDADNIEV